MISQHEHGAEMLTDYYWTSQSVCSADVLVMTRLEDSPQNEYFSDCRQPHPQAWASNYFNSICLYEAITNKLSSSSLRVFVQFNLLRYQTALVNKMFSLLTASPGLFFYDRIKLSKPQLGRSNFPGVHLFSLLFRPTTPRELIHSLPHTLPPLTGASGRKMTVFSYSKEINLIS